MTNTTDAKRTAKRPKPSPPADSLTIGWMTTLLTTTFCELAAVSTRAYVRYLAPDAASLGVFSGLMLFAAAVMGLILLAVTGIVLYRKRSNPPRGVVVFAIVVGLAPWIGMILQMQG